MPITGKSGKEWTQRAGYKVGQPSYAWIVQIENYTGWSPLCPHMSFLYVFSHSLTRFIHVFRGLLLQGLMGSDLIVIE